MIYSGRLPRLTKLDEHTLIGGISGALNRHRRAMGPALPGLIPYPPVANLPPLIISGFTLTGAGAALGNCTAELYRTRDDVRVETVTSDGSGIFTFSPVSPGELYYAVAYKAGSPDLAGTTRNILAGTTSVNIYLRDPTAADTGGAGGNTYSRSRITNA